MTSWYYSCNGKKEGPVNEDGLIKKIRIGQIKSGTLVWKRGMKTWEPLEVHFANELSNVTRALDATENTPQTDNEKNAEDTFGLKPLFQNESLIKKFLKPIIFSLSSLLLFWWTNQHFEASHFLLSTTIWIGSVILVLISGSFFIFKLWREASNKQKLTDGKKGGGLKLTCVCLAACLSIFVIAFLAQAPTFFKIDKVRQAYNNYSIEVDVASNLITVNGTIGSKFSKDLSEKLNLYAGINTITITSPGGLVDQAIAAAKEIEKHPEIQVIAKNECNSACLIIFMAPERRAAQWDMSFGFHATSPITNLPKIYHDGISFLEEEANSYLISKGIPTDLLERNTNTGNNDLEFVPAIQLAELDLVKLIDDNNNFVTTENAMWRSVENAYEAYDDPILKKILVVLRAIRETSPEFVKQHSSELYSALNELNVEKIRAAADAIFSEILPKAIMSADNIALYEYFQTNLNQIIYLKNMEQWNACVNYINGDASIETITIMSHDQVHKEFEFLEKLIYSAAAKKWTPQPVPTWAEEKGNSLIEEVITRLTEQGLDFEKLDSDNRIMCIYMESFFSSVQDEGQDIAPALIRWLNSKV